MDCRVKPGNDGDFVWLSLVGLAGHAKHALRDGR